jgi:ubiquinone/menaquinone biosynthesis C-methylase UbiE
MSHRVRDSYHLCELAVARDSTDPRHVNPPAFPTDRRVLDVGCGAGQTLVTCYGDRCSFGVDVDLGALQLGRTMTKQISFVCAAAESLPFSDGQFDVVIARVSLPYSNLRRSLREIHRVLKPGGFFWAVLHPLSLRWFKKANLRKPLTLVKLMYVTLNTFAFHFTGMVFPYRCGRYESFQTSSGIKRALMTAGFDRIVVSRQSHFVVTAEASQRIGP